MARLAVIVAHPDDETYGFAATIHAWVEAGGEASILSLTRGEAGVDRAGPGRDGEALAVAREGELSASAATLGADATALGFPDGSLAAAGGAEDAMAAWLEARRPSVVLTLGEDGAYGHVDHLACTALVARAARGTVLHAAFEPGAFSRVHRAMRRLYPERLGVTDPSRLGTPRADYAVDVGPHRAAKLAAVAAHRSQLANGDPRSFLGPGWIDGQLLAERFVHASGPVPEDPFWQEARCVSST